MAEALAPLRRKSFRIREAMNLILQHAADTQSRLALINIYRKLSDRARYHEHVFFSLKIGDNVFPVRMRVADIFVLSETLFERQYELESSVPNGGIIFDTGGNIGIASLWLFSTHTPSQLHVFEPASDNFEILQENLGNLQAARLNRAAIGQKAGFSFLIHHEFPAMHSVKNPGSMIQDEVKGETVEVLSLADYMERLQISRIDILKIDVEGSELDALRGLRERLSDVRVIVGEVHEDTIDVDDFYDYLKSYLFEVLWKRRLEGEADAPVHQFEAARKVS